MEKPLIINAPIMGIAPSPHLGYGDVRNLDIFTIPGVAKLNYQLVANTVAPLALPKWLVRDTQTYGGAYALDASGVLHKIINNGTITKVVGNVFTVTIASPAVFSAIAHGLLENDTVVLATTGALPTGLTAGTTYHVIATGLTDDAFELSASQGGAAINTSGSQSGAHTFRITTSAHGNGIVLWRDYLFICRDTAIDIYGPLVNIGNSPWTNNWKGNGATKDSALIDSDVLWHPMLVSKFDDKIYGGAGKYVFSLKELTTFSPTGTDGTEYTFTPRALTSLPSDHRIKCLEEQGERLMCGTIVTTAALENNVADIFPWDRSSPNHDTPISIEDFGVHALKTINSILYVLAGFDGKIYSSNGVQTSLVAQLPYSVVNREAGGNIVYYPGAITKHKGRLFFGVGNSGESGGCGVWSLLPTSQGNILNFENTVSTGNAGETNACFIGALISSGYSNLRVGFQENITYGIDDSNNRVSSYAAFFDSPLYNIGTPSDKNKFSQLELLLAKELAANEGIKVQYRLNLTDSWTDVGTYDFATYGAIHSYNDKVDRIKIAEADTIQFRILFSGSGTTPEFKSLILR